jgi:dihydrofolate synthase/folylpolyglutamate synthase
MPGLSSPPLTEECVRSERTVTTTITRYEQAITELFNRRPEIMLPGLRRIQALCHSLGQPQHAFEAIHLTGTNGKTTTARMITELLVAAGERVGTYTSPHLQDVRERFRVDDVPLDIDDLLAGLDALGPHIERVEQATGEMVTFFEASTALCLWAFARTSVDTGVIEVGMGGRWDATNVVDGRVAVIGRIQLDHPQLGSTVGEVAWEKAGIIKDGATVISANHDAAPARKIAEEVAQRAAQLHLLDRDFGVVGRSLIPGGQRVTLRGLDGQIYPVDLPLHGAHQAVNAACALAAVQAYRAAPLDPETVRAGFARVQSPGRLELFPASNGVPVLLDGAHNPAAATTLARTLEELRGAWFRELSRLAALDFRQPRDSATPRPKKLHGARRRILVIGIMADKDISSMVPILASAADEIVLTVAGNPRAASIAQLREACDASGVEVAASVDDVGAAVDVAAQRAGHDGIVVVTGSLYTVGEARAALGGTLA